MDTFKNIYVYLHFTAMCTTKGPISSGANTFGPVWGILGPKGHFGPVSVNHVMDPSRPILIHCLIKYIVLYNM